MSTCIQNFLKFRPLLSELVSRDIMMWGIQNEVYQSEQFAQFGNEFKVDKETLIAFNKGLAELAQREDKSRYIVQAEIDLASANEAAAEWSRGGKVDYSGVNLYIGFKSDVSNGGEKERKKITDILNKKMMIIKKLSNRFFDDYRIWSRG